MNARFPCEIGLRKLHLPDSLTSMGERRARESRAPSPIVCCPAFIGRDMDARAGGAGSEKLK
jgi:hypothetical protein